MSTRWQSEVDKLLASGKVNRAGIYGKSGGTWASSTDFDVSSQEQKEIVSGFRDPNRVLANGIRIAGAKYFCLQASERLFISKKGGDGVIVMQTKQAFIIGCWSAPIESHESTQVVETLGDYLISKGY